MASGFSYVVMKLPIFFSGLEQFVPRCFGERGDVVFRGRIRGNDMQHLAAGHAVQRLLGTQGGHWAMQTGSIEFFVKGSHRFVSSPGFSVMYLITPSGRAASCRHHRELTR